MTATKVPRQMTATIVVAASDSLETWRASWSDALGGYLICDGTADDVEIQAAIDALPAGGGKVVLLEGTFNLTAAIVLRGLLVLEGQGMAATILEQTDGTKRIVEYTAGANIFMTHLRDFTAQYDSGLGATLDGIYLVPGGNFTMYHCSIEHVFVQYIDTTHYAFYLGAFQSCVFMQLRGDSLGGFLKIDNASAGGHNGDGVFIEVQGTVKKAGSVSTMRLMASGGQRLNLIHFIYPKLACEADLDAGAYVLEIDDTYDCIFDRVQLEGGTGAGAGSLKLADSQFNTFRVAYIDGDSTITGSPNNLFEHCRMGEISVADRSVLFAGMIQRIKGVAGIIQRPSREIVENFDSLDGFEVNGSVVLNPAGYCLLDTTAVITTVAEFARYWLYNIDMFGVYQDLYFTVSIYLEQLTDQEIWVIFGNINNAEHFGFKILDDHIWATCGDGAETVLDLGVITTGHHRLDAFLIANSKARFSVDEVYKGEITTNAPNGHADVDAMMRAYIKNTAAASKKLRVGRWIIRKP